MTLLQNIDFLTLRRLVGVENVTETFYAAPPVTALPPPADELDLDSLMSEEPVSSPAPSNDTRELIAGDGIKIGETWFTITQDMLDSLPLFTDELNKVLTGLGRSAQIMQGEKELYITLQSLASSRTFYDFFEVREGDDKKYRITSKSNGIFLPVVTEFAKVPKQDCQTELCIETYQELDDAVYNLYISAGRANADGALLTTALDQHTATFQDVEFFTNSIDAYFEAIAIEQVARRNYFLSRFNFNGAPAQKPVKPEPVASLRF